VASPIRQSRLLAKLKAEWMRGVIIAANRSEVEVILYSPQEAVAVVPFLGDQTWFYFYRPNTTA
jgi:hypothetical protein